MRHRAESTPARRRGFLLPVVLGLILVAAMLAAHAIAGSADAAALSGSHILHQRAFEAAERGLMSVMQRLNAGEVLTQQPLQWASEALPEESVTIEYRETARLPLPSGYSSGRFIEQRSEVRSTGHLHETAAQLVAGFSRIVPDAQEPEP